MNKLFSLSKATKTNLRFKYEVTGPESPQVNVEDIAEMDIDNFFPSASTITNATTILISSDNVTNNVHEDDIDSLETHNPRIVNEEEVDQDYSFEESDSDCESEDEQFEDEIKVPRGYYMCNGKASSTRPVTDQLVTYVDCLDGGGRTKMMKRRKKKRAKTGGGGVRHDQLVQVGQLGLRNPMASVQFAPDVLDEWRFEQIIDTGGPGDFSVGVSLRNPTKVINGSGVASRSAAFALLYDEYKVKSVGVVIDFLNINPTQGFGRVAVDYDSVFAGPYTNGDLKDNQYMREFQGFNQISYITKVPHLTSGTFEGRPIIIHQGGFNDFNTPPDEGQIIITGERYLPGLRLFNITVTYRVIMRRRRTINNAKNERLRLENGKQSK